METTHKLTGGPLPADIQEEERAVRALITREADVFALHALARRSDGTFLYLIETPFATFPRFVIGSCDARVADARPLFRCGQRWSADAEWHRLRHGENHHLHV